MRRGSGGGRRGEVTRTGGAGRERDAQPVKLAANSTISKVASGQFLRVGIGEPPQALSGVAFGGVAGDDRFGGGSERGDALGVPRGLNLGAPGRIAFPDARVVQPRRAAEQRHEDGEGADEAPVNHESPKHFARSRSRRTTRPRTGRPSTLTHRSISSHAPA